jgi:hypothetical protein
LRNRPSVLHPVRRYNNGAAWASKFFDGCAFGRVGEPRSYSAEAVSWRLAQRDAAEGLGECGVAIPAARQDVVHSLERVVSSAGERSAG